MILPLVLQLAGSVVAFVAALFLATGQQGMPREAALVFADKMSHARVLGFVILRYPRLWRAGLVLLVLGFALQLLGYILVLKASP